ncbi:MAG: hypothetical protein AB8G18_11950 [Gammaproteobacteria bacterium]
MQTNRVQALVIILATALIGGCVNKTPVKMDINSAVPTPVIERSPVTAGVVYNKELTDFSTKETQQNGATWQIAIGKTNRTILNDIFKSLFETVQEFPDAASAASAAPPVEFTLVPRIDDYSMLSASDAGGKFWAVSMRHFIDIYGAEGQRSGTMEINSYGRKRKGPPMSNGVSEIDAATDDAFRDLAVTLIVELPKQLKLAGLIDGDNNSASSDEDSAESTP